MVCKRISFSDSQKLWKDTNQIETNRHLLTHGHY